jgi:hypothetical protein
MKPTIAPGIPRGGHLQLADSVVSSPTASRPRGDQLPDFTVSDAAITCVDQPDLLAGTRTPNAVTPPGVGARNQRRADP